jgi:hypothetical protein
MADEGGIIMLEVKLVMQGERCPRLGTKPRAAGNDGQKAAKDKAQESHTSLNLA